MANVLDFNIEVREFDFQLRFSVYFGTNNPEKKNVTLLISQAMG